MSTDQSEMIALTARITEQARIIDRYLDRTGRVRPTFATQETLQPGLPENIEASRVKLRDLTQQLNDLTALPHETVLEHTHNRLAYMQLIYRYDVAAKIPADGSISYRELAQKIKLDESSITQLLRFAITFRVFREPELGRIAHSPASKLLIADGPMKDFVGVMTEDMWPAAQHVMDALTKWPAADRPDRTGFNIANDCDDKDFYSILSMTPERSRRFGGAMSLYAGHGFSMKHLVNSYPWESIGAGTVVDLGGSLGDAGFAITQCCPEIAFISQDLPEIIEACKQGPERSVEFMAHNFFEEQPVKGADVYLLRWILHNWPDRFCQDILRNLVPALKTGAKIVIVDSVMADPGRVLNIEARAARAMDVCMLEINNSKDRTLEEFKALVTDTDERFSFQTSCKPEGSTLTTLIFRWDLGRD